MSAGLDASTVTPGSTAPDASRTVPTIEALFEQRRRALGLGARELLDRSDDPDEPLFVFADLAGHPFCIFVAPES